MAVLTIAKIGHKFQCVRLTLKSRWLMDRSKFTDKMTGRLVPIEQPRKDIAFIPDEMPAKWTFDERLWPMLADAKHALGTLNGIGQTLPDPTLLLRPLQNREAIASSKIEGTYVTPEQLLLYELDLREPRAGEEQRADWMEVHNYGRALQRGCELLKTLPICNRMIKDMHSVLMQGVRGQSKGPGMFRQWQVQIGSSGRFIPPPSPEAIRLMDDLENYMNFYDPKLDPLVRAFIVHYQFEAIHPFGDGNGRVGRLLLALMIYNWLDHSHPWLYLSAYFEAFKDEYMSNLFNISTRGAWTEWVEFCLRGTLSQANDSIRRCREFNRLRVEFHKRVDSPSCRTHDIINELFVSPVVSITSLATKFEIAYHTAKTDVARLVTADILRELPGVHPKSFFAHEVVRVQYHEAPDATPKQEAAAVASEPVQPSSQLPDDAGATVSPL
jgi:Fic family protein